MSYEKLIISVYKFFYIFYIQISNGELLISYNLAHHFLSLLYHMMNHASAKGHLQDITQNVRCVHPQILARTPSAPQTYLAAKTCEFSECSFSTEKNTYVTISERQEEPKLPITIHHRKSGTEYRNKCQTQTKVDCPAPMAKTSAFEWTLSRDTSKRWGRVAMPQSPGCWSVSPVRHL